MKTTGKIDYFFKRKASKDERDEQGIASTSELVKVSRIQRIEKLNNLDHFLNSLERDPGKRSPIWTFPPNQVDEIRRAYLNRDPYQIRLEEYPLCGNAKQPRRFQETWFSFFPTWLEYSPSKDAAYCLPCYLFNQGASGRSGLDTFITTGFRAWKRVRDGKHCAFLKHIGKDPCSQHNNTMKTWNDLLNQDGHINHAFHKQSSGQVMKNRLRLKTSIDSVRWLTLQACAFRGHDETNESKNQEMMGITDVLCQALQLQSQDIVNAMCLVRSTKNLIQELREDGWDTLFTNVTSFCSKHDVEIPDLNDFHSATRFRRSRLEENQVTIEHYFRVEIFFTTIDKQLQELNSRFSEQAMDLLTLSCALAPKDNYKTFNIDTICTLVEKYYPMDFNEQEKNNLPFQLRQFVVHARQESSLKNLSSIQELCSCLVETNEKEMYFLLDRLLRLIMTLPVSTATTKRSFSAMKIIKTRLRNKMEGGFLADSMTIYIEREISENISSESIIEYFKSLGTRRALL